MRLVWGTEMTDEELAEPAGLNRSQTHVDFMVGSDKMDIDGIREDGSRVPIFKMVTGRNSKTKESGNLRSFFLLFFYRYVYNNKSSSF